MEGNFYGVANIANRVVIWLQATQGSGNQSMTLYGCAACVWMLKLQSPQQMPALLEKRPKVHPKNTGIKKTRYQY